MNPVLSRSLAAAGLVLGMSVIAVAPAHAQVAGAATRAQVKMDRDTFLSMARYDHVSGKWVLRDDMAMPEGVPSRDEIKAMRDKFLSMNRWDHTNSQWVPVQGAPRDMSKLPREQVKAETERFLKMHRFDAQTMSWTASTR
jgi:hypothetical protein